MFLTLLLQISVRIPSDDRDPPALSTDSQAKRGELGNKYMNINVLRLKRGIYLQVLEPLLVVSVEVVRSYSQLPLDILFVARCCCQRREAGSRRVDPL